MDRRLFGKSALCTATTLAFGCAEKTSSRYARSGSEPGIEEEIEDSVLVEIEALQNDAVECLTCTEQPTGPEADISGCSEWDESCYFANVSKVPDLTPEKIQEIKANKYWRRASDDRPPVSWNAIARQPDYRHVAEFAPDSEESFLFSASDLSFLADRNAFSFRGLRDTRIVGLRGCAIASGAEDTGWGASHELAIATPNHIDNRCLIGVWRASDNQIRFFSGSTVPQVANMYSVLPTKGWGASMLPTGFYPYRGGAHKKGKRTEQKGALIAETSGYVVLRSTADLVYDVYDPIDFWTRGAAHNIHCASTPDRPSASLPNFDSAGCQVVSGRYIGDRTYAKGPWADFRRAAGLVDENDISKPEEAPGSGTFDYMLLTGLEALLASERASKPRFRSSYFFVRPGSRGQRVNAVQERLFAEFPLVFGRYRLQPDGDFGPLTTFTALMERNLPANDREYTTHIVAG